MNTYAFAGTQKNEDGTVFCEYQEAKNYIEFFKEQVAATSIDGNPLPTHPTVKADFQTGAHWTELVTSRQCRTQPEAAALRPRRSRRVTARPR